MSNSKAGGRSPSAGRLDTSVNAPTPTLAGMDTYVSSIEAIAHTMQDTQRSIAVHLDQITMYGAGEVAQGARQARRAVAGHDPLAGMTRIDTLKASHSLEGVRSFVSQRIGEAIAGGLDKMNYKRTPVTAPAPSGVGGSGGGRNGGGRSSPSGPEDFFGNPFTGKEGDPSPDLSLGTDAVRQKIGQSIAQHGVPTSVNQTLDLLSENVPLVGTYLDSTQEIKAQRAKNASYQRVTGGSNVSGLAQRWHEEVAGTAADLNPLNPLTGAQTRAAFKGVTALGYSGRGRQDRLDFIQHQAAARGIDVDQSIEALSIAAQNGKTNLDSLNDSLYGVSKAAEHAGVNADMARQHFLTLFGTATQQGLGGGATTAAAVLQGTMTSYGRQFQNTDSSNLLSRPMMYRFAAQSGMTPGQFQGAMRRGDPRAYRAISNNTMQMTANRLTPQQMEFIKGRISQYTNGNPNVLQTDAGSQIVSQIADEFRTRFEGQIDLFALSDYFSTQAGRTLDPSNVVEFIVQQMGGNTEAVRAQHQAGEVGLTNASGRSLKTGQQVGVSQVGLAKGTGGPSIHTHVNAGYLGQAAKTNQGVKAYREWQKAHQGQHDPVIEGLLQQVKNPNSTKVSVMTGDGVRVMSLAEAIRNYPNSVARGNVQIVEGDKNQRGQTVGQLLGGHVDASRDVSGELAKAAVGETYSHWESHSKQGKVNKKHDASGGTIELSEEAKRWFRYLPNDSSASAASGYPMENPNAVYGSR